jgi:hypothetical protein
MIDYDGRVFRVRQNTENGEVGGDTRFFYEQTGDRLTGTYRGGAIDEGHLLGRVFPDGHLEFCYHHLTLDGEQQAGRCSSVPERTDQGRLVLKETWQWFTGDRSTGTSELIELTPDEAPPENAS